MFYLRAHTEYRERSEKKGEEGRSRADTFAGRRCGCGASEKLIRRDTKTIREARDPIWSKAGHIRADAAATKYLGLRSRRLLVWSEYVTWIPLRRLTFDLLRVSGTCIMCVDLLRSGRLVQRNEFVEEEVASGIVVIATVEIGEVVVKRRSSQFLLEQINLVQEQDDRSLDEPSRVADGVEKSERLCQVGQTAAPSPHGKIKYLAFG